MLPTMPTEIVQEVFANVDSITDAVALSRTCRRMNGVFMNNVLHTLRASAPNDALFVSPDRLGTGWSIFAEALRLHSLRRNLSGFSRSSPLNEPVSDSQFSVEDYQVILTTGTSVDLAARKICRLLILRMHGNRSPDSMWHDFALHATKQLVYDYFFALERRGMDYVCRNGKLSLVAFVVYRHWNENWGIPPLSKSQSATFSSYTFFSSPSTRYQQLECTIVRLYIDWLICHVRWSWWRSLQGPLRLVAKKHLNYCRLYSARLMFHPDGYADWGYDENGYDEYGFNEYGYDIKGYNKDGVYDASHDKDGTRMAKK